MADKKTSGSTAEAHVRGSAPPGVDEERDEHGLLVLRVSEGDTPDAEPFHKIAEKSDAFDPNAALRAKMGVGPGLQDSEAKDPAVWVDVESDEARKAAADAEIQAAERVLERAKERAKAIRKGDPLDQEAGNIRG